MTTQTTARPSAAAVAVYEWLNPLPYGFFTAALIFDIIYACTANIQWVNGASWLIAIGLVFAIIPRLINLVQVWFGSGRLQGSPVKFHFWLNLIAIVLAIINAFVHSRDAYAVVPQGLVLSAIVVALLSLANILLAVGARAK
ncbi:MULTISPECIES: DUF2231 domain-containing protein [Serratia]|jgi:uncharacterized membrane protein|uniref:DUF2231 domain-containing protein n=1 Tax=Serratia TaxID=613 RepID=UPI000574749A|nr:MULTISPECIES: DUF2231 domain-containing protein [Serratia]EIY8597912.1 hypothetical protein [Serratia marcescens]EIY8854828.1 hypothetical protein [Serratia marcescens]EIY8863648.1 hypothetical protein [Serratia marcescens]EIY9016148.1 hypothetical protein [Serratia marcescens]EMB4122637.1 hypothetical protein [Serratia marcescens]